MENESNHPEDIRMQNSELFTIVGNEILKVLKKIFLTECLSTGNSHSILIVYWILIRRTRFLKFNNDSTNCTKMGFGKIIVKFIYRLNIYFAGSV